MVSLEVCTDNRGLYEALARADVQKPSEEHLFYLLKAIKDRLLAGSVRKLWWLDTVDMISDALTKGGLCREALLSLWKTSRLVIQGDAPIAYSAVSQ